MTTLTRLFRFALSIVALAALTVGIPVLLTMYGSIHFTGLPSASDVIAGLGNPLGDDAILGLLNLLVWTAWLAFMGTLVVEARTQLLDRSERRLPYLGSFQWLACQLVAGLLVIGSLSHGPRAAAATPAPASIEREHAVQATPPNALAPVAASPTTIEVEPGDSAWALAERHCGDGAQWRALWELNRGVRQADGRTWTDADLLRPGWILRLPTLDAPPTQSPTTVTVQAGDTLSAIAAERYGDPRRYDVIFDSNVGRAQPDGEALHDPNLIRPGWMLELPSDSNGTDAQAEPPSPDTAGAPSDVPPTTERGRPRGNESQSGPTLAPEATTTTDVSPTSTAPVSDDVQHDEAPSDVQIPAPLLGVASAGIALGVLQLIRRRRARRRLQLPVQRPVARPFKDGNEALHAEMMNAADPTEPVTVAAALRSIATTPSPTGPAQPVVLQIGTDWLDVQLDRPAPKPPAPWQPSPDGTTWQWDRSEMSSTVDVGEFAPLPTMVSIGVAGGDDGGRMLLNLEACGLVSIVGDPAEVHGLAASLALELAVSPLADAAGEIVMVGRDYLQISELDGVRSADRFEEVANDLIAAGEQIAKAADDHAPTAFALRATGRAADGWPPLIVFLATAPSDVRWDTIAALAASRRGGLVVVTVGWVAPNAQVIEASEGVVRVPDLGLAVLGQQVESAAFHGIDDALQAIELDEEPAALARTEHDVQGVLDLTVESGVEPDFVVRVLGPVRIDGLAAPLPPKATAAVVYASLHRPTYLERIRDQVWAGRDVSPKTVSNTFNRARSILGAAAVPHVEGGVLTLGSNVASDLDLFDARVATSDLRAALDLVTGRPFTLSAWEQRDSYLWVDEENWESRWDARVAAVAHDLAEDALSSGDIELAQWAAERGLLASPAHAALVGLVARAHLCAGNNRAAERATTESIDFHESLGLGAPPELVELLDQIRSAAPKRP